MASSSNKTAPVEFIRRKCANLPLKPHCTLSMPIRIRVDLNQLDNLAAFTRRLILDADFIPDDSSGVPTEQQFQAVVRYALANRIQHVQNRLRLPFFQPGIQLPAGLAELINGVGTVSIYGGNYQIAPTCDKPTNPNAETLTTVNSFIFSAINRGSVLPGQVSSDPRGGLWWLLEACGFLGEQDVPIEQRAQWTKYWAKPEAERGPKPEGLIDAPGTRKPLCELADRHVGYVYSQFPDRSSADAFRCAMVRGPGPGLIINAWADNMSPWRYNPGVELHCCVAEFAYGGTGCDPVYLCNNSSVPL